MIKADVAELVDARDLKSLDGNVVWVRVPPPAPQITPSGLHRRLSPSNSAIQVKLEDRSATRVACSTVAAFTSSYSNLKNMRQRFGARRKFDHHHISRSRARRMWLHFDNRADFISGNIETEPHVCFRSDAKKVAHLKPP